MTKSNPTSKDVIKALAAAGYSAELGDGEDYLQEENGREQIGFDIWEGWDGTEANAEEIAKKLRSEGYDAVSGDTNNGSDWPVYVTCKALGKAMFEKSALETLLDEAFKEEKVRAILHHRGTATVETAESNTGPKWADTCDVKTVYTAEVDIIIAEVCSESEMYYSPLNNVADFLKYVWRVGEVYFRHGGSKYGANTYGEAVNLKRTLPETNQRDAMRKGLVAIVKGEEVAMFRDGHHVTLAEVAKGKMK